MPLPVLLVLLLLLVVVAAAVVVSGAAANRIGVDCPSWCRPNSACQIQVPKTRS